VTTSYYDFCGIIGDAMPLDGREKAASQAMPLKTVQEVKHGV
jgi:hypothetical protein